MLELSLTRIFSVVFYYHFAFLAISVALFGLGAGGVFSYVIAARPANIFTRSSARADWRTRCGRPARCGSFFRARRTRLRRRWPPSTSPARCRFFSRERWSRWPSPEAIDRVDRAYFFDLAGAAAGCLMLIPFLNTVRRAEHRYRVGRVLRHRGSHLVSARPASIAGAPRRCCVSLLLVVLDGGERQDHMLDVRFAKGQKLPPEKFAAWNSFSRVGVPLSRLY